MTRRAPALAALLAFSAGQAAAVELQVQFGALERLLSNQVFTQDGRKYVHGDVKTRCNFAYLEHPQIQSAGGFLRIRARFTGRSALDMFGRCVGLGDAFTAVITARPVYRNGHLGLDSVTVTSGDKNGFYIRRVCAALSASLAKDFRYPLETAAKQALEDPGVQPDYRREMRDFRILDIHVSDDAVVMQIEFAFTVK